MSATLASTLGSREWIEANQEKLRDLFSRDGEAVTQRYLLMIGFKLKLMGVDWRTYDELVKTLIFLRKAGIAAVSNGGKIIYRA